ncbi:hypothetical protein BGZ76_004654 [Entomortierella beljakovae]|nr:hypothetical protein BGZ76_004654 [Entomortierella beljakovae]
MKFRITFPNTKSFDLVYSVIITVVFLASLIGVGLWTYKTKEDCSFKTSNVFNENCDPYALKNDHEITVRDVAFPSTIHLLNSSYDYRNTSFSCSNLTSYRIVLHIDRSVGIDLNASCNFEDGEPFTLAANSVVPNIAFGWDADLSAVQCPFNPKQFQIQSFIFDLGDSEETVVVDSFGLDPGFEYDCTIPFWVEEERGTQGGRARNSTQTSVKEYYTYKQQRAKNFYLYKNRTLSVPYSCKECSPKKGKDLILALLTALGSVGGIAYTLLITVGQYFYERGLKTKEYDGITLNKSDLELLRVREE